MALNTKTQALHRVLMAARNTLVRCGAYWKTDNIGSDCCPNMATRIVASIPCCPFHTAEARCGNDTPMTSIAHPQAELVLAIETYDLVINAK